MQLDEVLQALGLALEQLFEQIQLIPGADYNLTHAPTRTRVEAESSGGISMVCRD
jgi:hypothetical protein